jgi:hypothetical protein
VVRGRIPPPKLRNLEALRSLPPKRGRTTGLVGISRSSRLQGFAPLTNPLRQVTVASDLALVSSMGFGSPSRSRVLRSIPAMPEPASSLRPSRSPELGNPNPPRRGKPRRRGPVESLRRFTRLVTAEAGGRAGERWGSRPEGQDRIPAPRLFSAEGEPIVAFRVALETEVMSGGPGQCRRRGTGFAVVMG